MSAKITKINSKDRNKGLVTKDKTTSNNPHHLNFLKYFTILKISSP